VVEDGRIVEAGTPAELRGRGGRFADLFARWLAGAA
jgi:ABC-type multidrug transport system fused ATPase/permease subunit